MVNRILPEFLSIDDFEIYSNVFCTLLLDVFQLLRSSLCIYIIYKYFCVVSRVVVCCFKGEFSCVFLFWWTCNWGLMKVVLFLLFPLAVLLVLLLSLV